MSEIATIDNMMVVHGQNIFGSFDEFAKKIERSLHVSIIYRDDTVKIIGEGTQVERAREVIHNLLTLSLRGNTITEQNVDYAIALSMEGQTEKIPRMI